MYRKGFTLIELLVVIAIIGILSSVVLASLNTARERGNQAAVQSNLKTIQVQAELYYDSNSLSYGADVVVGADNTACTSAVVNVLDDTNVAAAISSAVAAGSAGSERCAVGESGQSWAVSVGYKTTGSFCVDNSGAATAGETAGGGGAGTAAACS
jgi:prepilin-type N-terminal cleavage/methylation domain-containing protein